MGKLINLKKEKVPNGLKKFMKDLEWHNEPNEEHINEIRRLLGYDEQLVFKILKGGID